MFHQLSHSDKRFISPVFIPKSSEGRARKVSPEILQPQLCFQKVVHFQPRKYPFSCLASASSDLLRTAIEVDPSKRQSVKALMHVRHCNLLSVQSIQHSPPKLPPSKHGLTAYSLLYETVPYSAKIAGLGGIPDQNLVSMIAKIDIREILADLTTYLMAMGIFHTVRLNDIGLTAEGTVKIYVSPEIICGIRSQAQKKTSILRNNEKLASWWETTFARSEISS
jgi:serine/threonine protein kinase